MLESHDVNLIVDRVVERLLGGAAASGTSGGAFNTRSGSTALYKETGVVSSKAPVPYTTRSSNGLFSTIRDAVSAAKDAQKRFAALPLSQRKKIIEEVRTTLRAHVDELANLAVEETGLGRVEDKK